MLHIIKLDWTIEIKAGSRIKISTSKIKKIIAIMKNRKEKGSREDSLGSKPHSNGDVFSRSKKDFFEIVEQVKINMRVININVNLIIKDKKIIYFIYKLNDWKSVVLFILNR